MKSISKKWWLGLAVVAVTSIGSVQWSQDAGLKLTMDSAQARVGRPATPASVAGVARRTTRRAVVGGAAAAGAAAVVAPTCARVLVNGVWVCR